MRGGKGFSQIVFKAFTIRDTELVDLGEDPCPGVSMAVNLNQTGTFCVISTLKTILLLD